MKWLITGATSGIGLAVAKRAHAEGNEILAVGRNEEQLEMLQHELGAKTLVADLTTDEGQAVIGQWIHAELPDVVVNCAGYGLFGPAAEHTVEEEMKMFNLDGVAVLKLTMETIKAWRSRGRKGTILNVASGAAFWPLPNMANYAAVKAYVSRLSQGLDVELKNTGIRVLVSCPGVVKSGFQKTAKKGAEFDYTKQRGTPILTVEYAADRIWKQIQSGKQVDIFNWQMAMMVGLMRYMPRKAKSAVGGMVVKQLMKD